MRITNSTLTTNFLRNLTKNLKNMQTYENQLSSGKVVSKPSDNPMLVSKIMDLNNNIMQNEQYKTNIQDSIGWVKTQDTALGDVTASLLRIRDLIIYGGNGTLDDVDRTSLNESVKAEIQGLADVLNTNFDGRYIFAGQKTTVKPFTVDEANSFKLIYNQGVNSDVDGSKDGVIREISRGVTVKLMTAGNEITTSAGAVEQDLGQFLSNVVDALENGDIAALSDGLLSDADKHLENVINTRSKVGATFNRLEAALARNESEKLNFTQLLSEREDIDIAEKYMELSMMKSIYQASLSVGASILQPSLLDYLR